MRKLTKLVVLAAALTLLCSIAAYAADTWVQDGDNWYCYDSDGNMVYGEWKKSGSNYYYLDGGTGAMLKDQLIDSGDYKYYVGADGARLVGQWQKVAVDNNDDGWEWMYFQSVSGRAAVNGNKTINSKKYYFDGDGYMLYGYRDAGWTAVDYPSAATYYYGSKDDGSAQTGWINITDGSDENYSDSSSIWFYFNKGVKKASTSTTLSGKKYYFGEDGKMLTGWTAATAINASGSYVYLGGSDDGVLKKSQWVYSDKDFGDGEDGDTSYWYYVGSNGVRYGDNQDGTITPVVKKISGKYYLFNKYAHMVSGIVYGTSEDKTVPTSFKYVGTFDTATEYKASGDSMTADELSKYAIMYFSADSTDGSMKTGTQTVTIDDDVTIYFDKHGYAVEGISSKKIYKNGVLQAAGDDKVAVKKLRVANSSYNGFNSYFLVNAAGTILKNSKSVDADGVYWVTNGAYDTANTYKIYKFKDTDNASYAATAVRSQKTSFTSSSTTYYIHQDTSTASSGYITVYWDTTNSDLITY